MFISICCYNVFKVLKLCNFENNSPTITKKYNSQQKKNESKSKRTWCPQLWCVSPKDDNPFMWQWLTIKHNIKIYVDFAKSDWIMFRHLHLYWLMLFWNLSLSWYIWYIYMYIYIYIHSWRERFNLHLANEWLTFRFFK